jgi:O-antigen ligase
MHGVLVGRTRLEVDLEEAPSVRKKVQLHPSHTALEICRFAVFGALAALAGALLVTRSTAALVDVGIVATLGWLTGVGLLMKLSAGVTRVQAARIIAWVGLFAPMAVAQQRTAFELQSSSPVSTLNFVQAALPLVALGSVFMLTRPRLRRVSAPELCILVYLALAFISTGWSVAPLATFLKAGQLTLAYCLVAVLVRLGTATQIFRELSGWLLALVLAALGGLAIDPSAAYTMQRVFYGTSSVRRLVGVFPANSPDLLGLVAAGGLICLVGRVYPRWATNVAVRWALGGACIATLLLTRSRTGLLVAGVGVLLTLAIERRSRLRVLLFAPAIAVAVVAASGWLGGPIGRYVMREQNASSFSTLTGRTQEWHTALSLWTIHPLTGYGYYSGHRLLSELALLSPSQFQNLDNAWVETLLDLGVVGIIPLALAVVWAFPRRESGLGSLRPAFVGLYAAFALASFVNPSLQEVAYPMVVFGTLVLLSGQVQATARLGGTSVPEAAPPPAVPVRQLHWS